MKAGLLQLQDLSEPSRYLGYRRGCIPWWSSDWMGGSAEASPWGVAVEPLLRGRCGLRLCATSWTETRVMLESSNRRNWIPRLHLALFIDVHGMWRSQDGHSQWPLWQISYLIWHGSSCPCRLKLDWHDVQLDQSRRPIGTGHLFTGSLSSARYARPSYSYCSVARFQEISAGSDLEP
jgi:hypothetical protein